jgi:hypothetical protein
MHEDRSPMLLRKLELEHYRMSTQFILKYLGVGKSRDHSIQIFEQSLWGHYARLSSESVDTSSPVKHGPA